MPEPDDFDQSEQLLPGLEPPRAGDGANELAARRTLVALAAAGLVAEQHAVMCESLLTGCRQLDRASSSAKAKDYGVANLLAQIRETFLVLAPSDVEGGDESEWSKWNRDLAAAVAQDQRSAAAARDASES